MSSHKGRETVRFTLESNDYGHAEMSIDADCDTLSGRERRSVHAYIEQDLNDAQAVSFDTFVDVVFGLDSDTMKDWISSIKDNQWLRDETILKNLQDFCAAKKERRRYHPFATIVNRILELARGSLSGVPDTYPISFCI